VRIPLTQSLPLAGERNMIPCSRLPILGIFVSI